MLYQAVDTSIWQGRSDSQEAERYYQVMQCIDLQQAQSFSPQAGDYALLGFCSDAGVVRNLGRPGSVAGPDSLRAAFANLPLIDAPDASYYDMGNIHCEGDLLENAQQALADTVADLLQQQLTPIVLGGGHETAWGHYLGLVQANKVRDIGIINFDAHFDLRQPQSQGTSGTPFYQIASSRREAGLDFSYLCLGIQALANTRSLFATAAELGVNYCTAAQMQQQSIQQTLAIVQGFMAQHEAIYLSVCLDVFAQAVAPGVSAPQPLGLMPAQVLPLIQAIAASNKVLSMDIVELSPPYDQQAMTARLAASVLAQFVAYSH